MSELRPYEECPRYSTCSVNICPLDPDQDLRTTSKLDKEQECPMEKQVRVRIGTKYPDLLPKGGLKPKEWAAQQRFLSLSPAQREEAKKRLSAYHFKKGGDK